MDSEFETKLKTYFEEMPAAVDAATPLKDGVEIELVIEGHSFTFKKESKKNRFMPGAPETPDVVFTLTKIAAEKIITSNAATVGEIGIDILKLIVSKDPSEKVRVASRVGPLTLIRNGYLNVIGKGGGTVAKFLAQHGLGSLGKIKNFISSIKQS